MKFGQQLDQQLFTPWKDNYIDYDKIKCFLKHKQGQLQGWTHIEEAYFANILLIAELSKVHAFVESQLTKIRDSNDKANLISYIKLNAIGFQKILKKHDKWTGIHLSSSVHFCDIGNQFESLVRKVNNVLTDEQCKRVQYWIHPEDIVKVQTILLFHLHVSVQKQLTHTMYFEKENDFSCYSRLIKRQINGHVVSAEWVGALALESNVSLWHKIFDHSWSYDNDMPSRQNDCLSYNQLLLYMQENNKEKENTLAADTYSYIKAESMRPVFKYSRACTVYDQLQKSLKVTLNENIILRKQYELDPVSFKKDSGEAYNFPCALLEIEIDTTTTDLPHWLVQLNESQLIYEVPFFSVYLHGISYFYNEKVSLLPWWLRELKSDFRKKLYGAQTSQTAPNYEATSKSENFQNKDNTIVDFSSPYNHFNSINMNARGLDQFDTLLGMYEKDQYKYNGHLQPSRENNKNKSLFSDKLVANLKTMKQDLALYRQELNNQYTDNMSMAVWLHAKLINDKSILSTVQSTVKKPKKKKVEPNIFFSNERTFINWLQFSALLLTVSLGLINFGDRISRASGAFFIIISIILAFYAQLRFQYRSWQIQYRSGSRFDDIYGPAVLCFVLIIALFVNLGLRINQPLPSNPSPFAYNVTLNRNLTTPDRVQNPEQFGTTTDGHVTNKYNTTQIQDPLVNTKSPTNTKKKAKDEDEDEDED